MKKTILARTGAALAATTLAFTLAGCAGGVPGGVPGGIPGDNGGGGLGGDVTNPVVPQGPAQSVDEACKIAREVMLEYSQEIGNLGVEAFTDGSSFADTMKPVLEGLSQAQTQVNNAEVGQQLSNLSEALTEFTEVLSGLEMPDFDTENPDLQASTEALAKMQEVLASMEGTQDKLEAAGNGMTQLCGDGS